MVISHVAMENLDEHGSLIDDFRGYILPPSHFEHDGRALDMIVLINHGVIDPRYDRNGQPEWTVVRLLITFD